MTVSLTFGAAFSLFATLFLLALLPSLSSLTVATRSASLGGVHGAAAAAGVVAGDLVFILAVLLGLTALAATFEPLLTALKIVGGIYLIWLAMGFLRANRQPPGTLKTSAPTGSSSFLAGLLITLGDHKAILFYVVFFPAFIELKTASAIDTVLILAIAAVSVGGAKLAYAFAGRRAGILLGPALGPKLNTVLAIVMAAIGFFLIASETVRLLREP